MTAEKLLKVNRLKLRPGIMLVKGVDYSFGNDFSCGVVMGLSDDEAEDCPFKTGDTVVLESYCADQKLGDLIVVRWSEVVCSLE